MLRAPFKASEKSISTCKEEAEKKPRSNFKWKAGMRKVATEEASARRGKGKKHSSMQVLKLLKEAICLYSVIEDIGPDYSADLPDLSNMSEEGTCGNIVGLMPYSSDGKEVQRGEEYRNKTSTIQVQKGGEDYRIQNTEYRNATSTTQVQKRKEYRIQNTDYRNTTSTTQVQKGGGEAETMTQSSDGLTSSSESEAESSDSGDMERGHSAKKISKKYVKRPAKKNHLQAESSIYLAYI